MEETRIAIVAMSGVFPDADSVDELWDNIKLGREAGTDFSTDALEAAGLPRSLTERIDFVRRRPTLNRCDLFDEEFFDFSPIEAEALDPQLRLLLQCAYHAIEEAGSVGRAQRLRTGTFVGLRQSRYLDEHLMRSPRHGRALGYDYLQMINRKDSAATLLAYKLDLGGPAISVNTACSTSLLAAHLACNSLLAYECDLALAGGAAISSFGPDGDLYVPGGILSKDGRCRPFSADADGTIDGSGVAVVGLKRLEDAMRDSDHIYALILGSAVNNDGGDKVGYTAPSVSGQARVIADALALSGVSPASIGYVEAHGTGTRLGDPIEVRALTQVYRRFTEQRAYCHLGSIKANVGHLGAAAGVTGLIKAALVVRDGFFPPQVNYSRANPDLALATSPFKIVTEPTAWPAQSEPRRAAVSSFGVGGTNVHAILEERPRLGAIASATLTAQRFELCLLSAKSPGALGNNAQAIARHLESTPAQRLDDVAATLAETRSQLPWRRFEVADSISGLAERLANVAEPVVEPRRTRRRVAFLFPGQGSQHPGMGQGLYARWQPFRQAFDEVAALVQRHSGIDLLALLKSSDETALQQTSLAQPALFATSMALARTWRSLGVKPDVLLGHSVGDIAAACLAGVFSLEDGVRLVCARGRLMQAAPAGTMLAVGLDASILATRLVSGVEIAVVNGRAACVVAGPAGGVESLRQALAAEGVHTRPLHTSHAFHSASMAEASRALADVVRGLSLLPPTLPVVSSVTGEVLTTEQACSPLYWAQAVRSPVQFFAGLQSLVARQVDLALEVGPGTTLTSLARAEGLAWCAIATLPHPSASGSTYAEQADQRAFLRAAGTLWAHGVPVDTDVLAPRREGYRRVTLPGYAFDARRHWVEAGASAYLSEAAGAVQVELGVALRQAALQPVILPATMTSPPKRRVMWARAPQQPSPTRQPWQEADAFVTADTADDADLVACHSTQPVDEALMAFLAGTAGRTPCVLADFDQPSNQRALARLVRQTRIGRDLVLLDGHPFILTLERPAARTPAPFTLQQLIGLPPSWLATLRAHRAADEPSSALLNIVRLAGTAEAVTGTLQQVEAGAGTWLLIDVPDLSAAERLHRLASARHSLASVGVTETVWLALDGPAAASTPDVWCELLDALVPLDGAAYTAKLRVSPGSTFPSENPLKENLMNDVKTELHAPANSPTDVRTTIQSIWSEVLGMPNVGLEDNFFDLGGNSLWALKIVSQVNNAFGCEIHLSELLNSATVNELAVLVEKRLLNAVDDDELQALLSELGDAPEDEVRQMLAHMSEVAP